MHLKLSEVISLASFVGWFLAYMKTDKRWVKWFFGAACVIAAIVAFCTQSDEPKVLDSHNQMAITSGNNSPAINQSGPNLTLNINNGPTLELIEQAMRNVQKEKDPDLKKEFPLGYILFTATERKQIVPLRSPMDEVIKINWRTGYSVSFTNDVVFLELPDITIQEVTMQGVTVYTDRRVGATIRMRFGKARLVITVVSTNEDNIIFAMGLESVPQGPTDAILPR